MNDGNVNPDLARERQKATFNVEELSAVLYGGQQKLQRKRYLENIVLQDPFLGNAEPIDVTSDRGSQYEEAMRRNIYSEKLTKNLGITDRDEKSIIRGMIFPNIPGTFDVHKSMFTVTIMQHATKDQAKYWMPKVENLQVIGTYAQTEIGHGTFVRGLETTATYDPTTREFIIHSPNVSSIKYWPGNLGKTVNYCVLMAQLYTKNKCHGVHPFMVPLRSMIDHTPLPGVEVGDIGPKLGFTNSTNGFLRLTNYRIPREYMLMRYARVEEDGTYIEPPNKRLAYGTMVYIRAGMVSQVAKSLAVASTIAVRYSAVRHQTESKPGGEELQILDYQTQQYKIFTQLATAYALWFAGAQLVIIYNNITAQIEKGNLTELPQLHALTASLKAYSTSTVLEGVEECRMACGGHGYLHASGFPKLFAISALTPIVEGETVILYLQTGRFLLKCYRQVKQGQKLPGFVAYLSETPKTKSQLNKNWDIRHLIEAFEHRAARLVADAAKTTESALRKGSSPEEAWNMSTVQFMWAAKAHCHTYVVKAFAEFIKNQNISKNLRKVLDDLCSFYAVYLIRKNLGDFLQDGYFSNAQVGLIENRMLELLAELRINAVGLVDAFDFRDRNLESCLGRYDGQVYQALYDSIKNSSFNKSDVHPAVKKYLPNISSGKTGTSAKL